MAAKTKSKKPKKKKTDKVTLIESFTSKLLSLMGVEAKFEIFEDKENDAVVVNIQTEDEAGLLIGNRGETLNSIQAVLGIMVRQKQGEWQRIIVNIADWREKQEERLRELAKQTADRAKNLEEPQPLYNLTSLERRIVHLALADDEEVETESLGEGQDRYLVVRTKEKGKK